MRRIAGLDELRRAAGETLGPTGWHTVTQDDVDAFVAATGDGGWIHSDPERAAETGFGGTLVPGHLTLALIPRLSAELLELDGFAFAVAHGFDRVRFPAPLRVGAPVRMTLKIDDVDTLPGDVAQLKLELTFEGEDGGEPILEAQTLARLYSGGAAAS